MSADSDEYLIRYILRDLPESEAERLDERSVTDEAFAQRLRDFENDLVDRYAREDATDESLNRFEQRVRDSSYLRNKVQFARALQKVSMHGRDRCCHGARFVDWQATLAGGIRGGGDAPARGDRVPWSADGIAA